MSNFVISVESLSKVYRLGQIGTGTFSHDLNLWWARVHGKPNPMRRIGETDHGNRAGDEIWALRDINFSVQQGEVLGIIGRNGAGKSTLLKILSRITSPTRGRIRVKGRVASLLEVGTGFHPELTGRENIYLNGAILGMSRFEIDRKFDEIVDFSGVETFIDTPVKRYSSGMYVRLAFAVAAHLDPEILVVDEVLAVGDAEFQKKCLGKMGEVAKGGRTVLFVSHNLPMIRQLCRRAILLNRGDLVQQGDSERVVSDYLAKAFAGQYSEDVCSIISSFFSDPAFRLLDVRVLQNGKETNFVGNGEPVQIEIEYNVLEKTHGLRVFFDLYDKNEVLLFRSFHDSGEQVIVPMQKGHYLSKMEIPANWLAPSIYSLQFHAGIHNTRMLMPSDVRIPIYVHNTGIVNKAYAGDPIRGSLAPNFDWITIRLGTSQG
ncbi:MAG: ABC transporter ATP-binding protein [Anaerolineales bacterium]|nr:ABC transporter ATP-binding protein [Anaerolineales bacterium]